MRTEAVWSDVRKGADSETIKQVLAQISQTYKDDFAWPDNILKSSFTTTRLLFSYVALT